MKFRFLLICLLLISTPLIAEDFKNSKAQIHVFPEIKDNAQHQNTLELTPKSISIYRKLGCLFANKFYSEGAILNIEGIKSKCISSSGYFKWQELKK